VRDRVPGYERREPEKTLLHQVVREELESLLGDPLVDRARASTVTAGAASGPAEAAPKASTRRYLWADLLQRVFEVDALCCPRCGGRMRMLAAITEAAVA
jgi:hypothetical protein